MRTLLWFVIICLIAFGGYYYFYMQDNAAAAPDPSLTPMATSTNVSIIPLEHATGILWWDNTALYFDPVGTAALFAGQPAADIVLITDIHGDHLSTSTLSSVVGNAKLIVPQAVKDLLPAELQAKASVLSNGQSQTVQGFTITAVPMYNLPSAANKDRHTKGRGNGYLIEKDGFRVYLAGDTAGTPEMRALTDIDIAIIPMNPTYTMSVEEAADAVLVFKPKTVYPYHYREPSGLSDVSKFEQLVNAGNPDINVVLGAWYPSE